MQAKDSRRGTGERGGVLGWRETLSGVDYAVAAKDKFRYRTHSICHQKSTTAEVTVSTQSPNSTSTSSGNNGRHGRIRSDGYCRLWKDNIKKETGPVEV